MRTCCLLGLTVVVAALLLSPTPAAPIRPEKQRPAITLETATKIKPLREIDTNPHRFVRVPGRSELAIIRWAQPIEIVDDAKFTTVRKIADGKKAIHYSASRDGTLIAWGEANSRINLQEVEGGKTIEIETGNDQPHPAFSVDSKMLATGGYGDRAKLWDRSGKLIRELEMTGKGGLWPVFSPDGKVLAIGNRNYETRLFDVASGKLLHTLPKKMTQELAFNPDGSVLATGYVDGTVALWDVAKGEQLLMQVSGCREIYTLDWTPKGDVLATAGDGGKIILWDGRKLTKLNELDSPGWVIAVRFTADGGRLLTAGAAEGTGSVDRKVVVWGLGD